jgi:hypothetical protein
MDQLTESHAKTKARGKSAASDKALRASDFVVAEAATP